MGRILKAMQGTRSILLHTHMKGKDKVKGLSQIAIFSQSYTRMKGKDKVKDYTQSTMHKDKVKDCTQCSM